jgi:ABC-type transport system involved in cytochrome bd biosynthesis fused ATPase/permease subunit
MYIVPLMVIILLAIVAVAWSPIFAVIIFAIVFALFLAYVGLSRRADQGAVATPEARRSKDDKKRLKRGFVELGSTV